jgi:FdhE protein
VSLEDWLSSHPYLQPVAALHAHVEGIAAEVCTSVIPAFRWDSYLDDFLAGVPLLENPTAAIDFIPADKMLRSLVQKLAYSTLNDKLSEQVRTLQEELRASPENSVGIIAALLSGAPAGTSCPGLLRYLGWTVLSRYLYPVVSAFETWSEKERWLRPYCPTCGSLPAMAHLVGADPARTRFLSCGCCGTRWQYRRIGCPFCENRDDHRLAVLMVEREAHLRIDYCQSCNGYLKTYCGQGNESILLADWTSIHLDLVAGERGLSRLAASLYEV